MEKEKQVFLLNCIEKSNELEKNAFEMQFACLKQSIEQAALNGYLTFLIRPGVVMFGFQIERKYLDKMMIILKENGFKITYNAAGYDIRTTLISWENP